MNKLFVYSIAAMVGAGVVFLTSTHEPKNPYDPAFCAGPPLLTPEALADAVDQGYDIDREHRCIDKRTYAEITRRIQENDKKRRELTERQQADQEKAASEPKETLSQARAGFYTAIAVTEGDHPILPNPPSNLFVRADYTSNQQQLAAFVTPNPNDNKRHPAIIWLTGGDTSTLDNFWEPQNGSDQTASGFRDAGFIMMFPTLRGGNRNPGAKEFFLGEVDDVLAAADRLAELPYVDPDRIYLGGHSTGGTLALLTSEASARFRAVFAFGPVADIENYGQLIPVNFANLDRKERSLRSPVHWLDGITKPTFVIEGKDYPGNANDARELCRETRNTRLHCVLVEGKTHFTALPVMTAELARLLISNPAGYELVMHLPGEIPRGDDSGH